MTNTTCLPHRCGYVAVAGRSNVGKSTLVNQLIQEKLCITADRPQTTRHAILGIDTHPQAQIIYIDTPGLHDNQRQALNRQLNKTARHALLEAQVILFVVAGNRWLAADQYALEQLSALSLTIPVFLVCNKIDLLLDRALLLPYFAQVRAYYAWAEMIPVSAKTGDNIPHLQHCIVPYLPVAEPLYPADQFTNRSERFLASELIREPLMRYLGQELPYTVTVEIETFTRQPDSLRIDAVIWVMHSSQKAIVIGHQGQRLKQLGQQARQALEQQYQQKVYLHLWVKVKAGWADHEGLLQQLGYRESFE